MIALASREPFEVDCNHCKKTIVLYINMNDMADWHRGVWIQNAMSYLSADERELLISQTCGTCFDKMFGNCEE